MFTLTAKMDACAELFLAYNIALIQEDFFYIYYKIKRFGLANGINDYERLHKFVLCV